MPYWMDVSASGGGQRVVRNDIALDSMVVLTGPNTAGKGVACTNINMYMQHIYMHAYIYTHQHTYAGKGVTWTLTNPSRAVTPQPHTQKKKAVTPQPHTQPPAPPRAALLARLECAR